MINQPNPSIKAGPAPLGRLVLGTIVGIMSLVSFVGSANAVSAPYVGQNLSFTPHGIYGPTFSTDAGFSNNFLNSIRTFTGQNSTTLCTDVPSPGCGKYVELVSGFTVGSVTQCSLGGRAASTVQCGRPDAPRGRAQCLMLNSAAFIWANCWKDRN
jgi:hypothetical protein